MCLRSCAHPAEYVRVHGMRTGIRCVAPLAVAVVITAGSASASGVATAPLSEPFSIDQEIAHFVPVARSLWPGSPCAGRESIAVVDASDGWVGHAYRDACRVEVLRTVRRGQWLCKVLVHEFGHLAGYDHVNDRGSIMYRSSALATDPVAQSACDAAAAQQTLPAEVLAARAVLGGARAGSSARCTATTPLTRWPVQARCSESVPGRPRPRRWVVCIGDGMPGSQVGVLGWGLYNSTPKPRRFKLLCWM
jgi:Matrixin